MPQFTTTDMNVAEVVCNGTVAAGGSDAKTSTSVWYWRRTTIVNPVDPAHVESAFQAAIAIPLTNFLNVRYTQTNTQCRIINDALQPYKQVSRAVAGQVAGDSMATVECAYMLMRTAVRSKGIKGSKHLYPLSETQTTIGTSDVLNAGALVLFGLLATAVLAGFTDSDGNIWVPTIFSRPKVSQTARNPTKIIVNDVASIILNKRVSKMKKRYVRSVY